MCPHVYVQVLSHFELLVTSRPRTLVLSIDFDIFSGLSVRSEADNSGVGNPETGFPEDLVESGVRAASEANDEFFGTVDLIEDVESAVESGLVLQFVDTPVQYDPVIIGAFDALMFGPFLSGLGIETLVLLVVFNGLPYGTGRHAYGPLYLADHVIQCPAGVNFLEVGLQVDYRFLQLYVHNLSRT